MATATNNMLSKGRKFLNHVLPGIARPIHILWNQVIGFFFIVLALLPVPTAIRNFGKEGSGAHLALTIPFVLIMGWFGISSFWRARKDLQIMIDREDLPGQYPYTRGIYPDMYRSRLWTMRQYAGFGTAEESNQRYRYLLSQGITGLSVAFDLPTQMGMDSDHPLAAGEVGRVGVAICSLEDMRRLFDGIRLADITTSMTINSTAAILLSLYVLVARSQGANLRKLSGTIQNDILKEYIARGTYIYPPRPAMRIITDLFAWAARELPEWNTISISGYHIREAGSTAVQEVAFTLANAIAYIEAALKAGLQVDEFAPRLSFFFNAHNNFLEEIAKVPRRAAAVCLHHARPFRRAQSTLPDDALSRADRRIHPYRAAARCQRGARFDAGAGGRAGRRAIAAHQFQG